MTARSGSISAIPIPPVAGPGGPPIRKNPVRAMNIRPPTPEGLKPKDLIGVPWLLAFALQKEGWYLRADIIWNKPNCQPESVKDRPTRCHEYIFLFSKSEHYRYDATALRGPNGRNIRTVWDIHTRPYPRSAFRHVPASAGRALHQARLQPRRIDPRPVHWVGNYRPCRIEVQPPLCRHRT